MIREDWGIAVFPGLRASAEGEARRAKDSAAKRRSNLRGPEEEGSVVGTQESASSITTRARGKAKVMPSTPLTGAIAGPSRAAGSMMGETRVHQVSVEPLEPFIAALADPSTSGLDLDNRLIELRVLQRREEAEARYIAELVEDRARLMDKLMRRMARRISELGAETSDEEVSGGSEDGEGEEVGEEEEEGDGEMSDVANA